MIFGSLRLTDSCLNRPMVTVSYSLLISFSEVTIDTGDKCGGGGGGGGGLQ